MFTLPSIHMRRWGEKIHDATKLCAHLPDDRQPDTCARQDAELHSASGNGLGAARIRRCCFRRIRSFRYLCRGQDLVHHELGSLWWLHRPPFRQRCVDGGFETAHRVSLPGDGSVCANDKGRGNAFARIALAAVAMIQSDGVRGKGMHPRIFVRRDGLACLVRDPYESDSLRLVLGICFVQMLDGGTAWRAPRGPKLHNGDMTIS